MTTVNTIGVTTVSDGTNTYALVASDSVLTAVGLNAVYCWNYAATATTPTITFTLGAAATGGIILYDLSGATGQCHITGSDDSIGQSALSSSPAVASYTPSSAGYEIGFLNVATTTPTVTAGGGQTKDNDATSSTMRLASESIANTGTATTTPFTLSVSGAWNEVSVTFVATPEVTVTQPLVLCVMESGAPTGTSFSMFGGGIFLRTILSAALPCTTLLNVVADKNSPITVEAPTDGANTRHRFNASSDSTVTAVVTTCSSGTCGNKRLDVYYELQQTYQATPKTAQTTWDSGLGAPLVFGTVAGASSTQVASITLTGGAGAQSATGWADYNTQAQIQPSLITGAPANSQWTRNGACSFTQTTGGNTDNCDYWKQWGNVFKYSVSHGSPTAPLLTCNSIGGGFAPTLDMAGQTVFCDNGSTAVPTDPTTGSTSSERWSDNAQTFTITTGGSTDIFAYYDQLQNTYRATQVNPVTWDGIFSITVVGNQFGASATGCTASTIVAGATAQCSAWFDYNTPVTMLSPIPVTATEQWAQSSGPSGNVLTDTSGSNTRNVNYARQWKVTMAASPSVGGAVSPATGFFNDGVNGSSVALSQAANPGYAFAQPWTSTSASVTFNDATSTAPTMTVKAAATVTATFAEVSQGGGEGQGGGPNSFPNVAATGGLATTWFVGPDGKTTTSVFQQGADTSVLSGNLASLVIIAVVLGVLVFLNARKSGYTPSYKRGSAPDYHRPR